VLIWQVLVIARDCDCVSNTFVGRLKKASEEEKNDLEPLLRRKKIHIAIQMYIYIFTEL